tara:strand:+ start:26475 stop:27851 length:1377 start_codon:yes stop_codon:yes gene_type:complete
MQDLLKIYKEQKEFFDLKKTIPVKYRKQALRSLSKNIKLYEEEIYNALEKDLGKPRYESFLSEILFVQKEIKIMLSKIDYWSKPKRVSGSIYSFPSKDYILPSPFGCVLNISPWNYPFQLTMSPLIGAVAAGNTVVVKPSEHSSNTSLVIKKVIENSFEKGHAATVLGDAKEAQKLLSFRWDYIFFTGSTTIGKIVAKAAAEFLTPTTLELGGKSPCIVDETVDVKLTAKRIVWGKFLNCGQTCIAPDYILVNHKLKKELISALILAIKNSYGENVKESKSYGRIINENHLNRINKMIENTEIIHGGSSDIDTKFFEPTIISDEELKSGAMKEEIFGPVLPIISYKKMDEAYKVIKGFDKPLAAYIFSKNKTIINEFKQNFSAGAIVANDSIIQVINSNLPFGGVGNSGIGAYHGQHSFDLFTHFKPFIKRGFTPDPYIRYAPYPKKWSLVKKILEYL